MKKSLSIAVWSSVLFLGALQADAAIITNVVETGGDNEATDTIPAKYTGQTFAVTQANEPFPGAVVGGNFTVPTFGTGANGGTPTFVDRTHRYWSDPALPVPTYLVGLDYIMSGNDNRDDLTAQPNSNYRLDITVNAAARAYMLIDNRLSDGDAATPPTIDATHMQWINTNGWVPRTTGRNRTGNLLLPDEVAMDEASDSNTQNYYSVYFHDFPAGTFSTFQANNDGRNMYGVVVGPVPEPGTLVLFGLGLVGIFRRRRS